MKKILLSLIISIYAFGDVPEKDGAAPQPNYQLHFPENKEQDSTKSMVGDDDLKQNKIEYGIGYENDVGISFIKKVKDEKGVEFYIDVRTGEEIRNFEENKQSDELKNSVKGISGGQPTDEDEMKAKNTAIQKAKEARNEELKKNEYTPKRYENMFLHNVDAPSRGSSYLNSTFLNPKNLENEIESKQTQFYMDTYGFSQLNNSVEIYKSNDNASKLADAYNFMETYKASLNAKYSDKSIKCFITRELIPKYFCPMIGKENTLFGGDEKTESGTGFKNCNANCRDEKQCAQYKVLDSTLIDMPTKELDLYPWDGSIKFIKSDKLSEKMMIDKMEFEIMITPSDKFEGTEEEFEKFLSTAKIKFKFDLIKQEETAKNPPIALINGETIEVKSALTKKEFYVSNTTEYITIRFYKPFISEQTLTETLKHGKDWEKIGGIKIQKIKGNYKDVNIYFCPFRQMVNSVAECNLNEGGEIIKLHSGSQIYNICTDPNHKIGPDRVYGGFYTNESCKTNCVESKDCLPTYKHYSDFNSEDMFKANIGCVDSEDNTACSISKCEELLGDNDLRPINEWVTYNEDSKKQTISNSVINTSVLRPKFNLGDELSTSDSYGELFQAEMKDAAYKYMIDNASFNRIAYRIGEEAPRKMSYGIDSVDKQARLFWNLKPASFDIENGVDYNLYLVLELEQLYKPIAGVFMINGNKVQVNRDEESDLQFMDKTYMIKTSASEDSWKTFKKIEFTNVRHVESIMRCSDGENQTLVRQVKGYWNNKVVPSNCHTYDDVSWPATPQMNIDRNAFYDSVTDTFATYDANAEKAEVFKIEKFSSNKVINTYQISNFLQNEIELIPGALIRDQESLEYDKKFRKIYNKPFGGTKVRGWPYNYKIYAFYNKKKLSYNEVLAELKKENILYDKVNANNLPKVIKSDGEINNNIRPFILGNPNMTTVNMETTPFVNEEGGRVFKFMFLYDDDNEGKAPFENYKIKGN